MKKIIYTIVSTVIITILSISNVFAMPCNPNDYTSVSEVSNLLDSGIKRSKATENSLARGKFFMSADLTIMNNGGGKVGALAVALTSVPVDEAYITVYLDRWDETTERWRQVNYYEAEYLASEYPDGISTPTLDISFIDQPKGYYYRLRGVFAVVYNGEVEALSPTTDGILID